MYKKADKNQLGIEGFEIPFEGELTAENRWIKTVKLIPWDLVEEQYATSFKAECTDGRPAISARIAFGAIYIKEQENLTDVRTVEYIAENPYMQYFLGLKDFHREPLFDASMMVYFRKRFNAEAMNKINEEMYRRTHPALPDDDENGGNGEGTENKGVLILDATAAPADIRYPTDLSLLNESRENTEEIIDKLWEHTDRKGHKTAYNRQKARTKYLKVAKQRKPRKGALQQAVTEQLGFVERNIQSLDKMLIQTGMGLLSGQQLERIEVIREVCRQQRLMADKHIHTCDNRIVSLRQPHVRPIVRGKAGHPYEFGQKLAFSVVDGYTFIDVQRWDNFNEGTTLKDSAEKYKERFGVYPQAILADTIYRNKENRAFCKEHHIRLSGPRLGRPKQSELSADREQAYRDSCKRNMVESRNGIAKRRFGLDLIMAYLKATAETEAALQVFAMNIFHCLRVFLRFLFLCVFLSQNSKYPLRCSA